MKNSGKRKWIIIGVVIYVIISIPVFIIFGVNRWSQSFKEREFVNVYEDMAIEFIQTQPDIIDKYGDNCTLYVEEFLWKYMPDYKQSIGFVNHNIPSSLEEFENNIEKITFWVNVDRADVYVVVFEKSEEGNLEISDWYLDTED